MKEQNDSDSNARSIREILDALDELSYDELVKMQNEVTEMCKAKRAAHSRARRD